MVDLCPHCGAVMESAIFLAPVKQRIYDYIRRHAGCTSEEIMRSVWADDPDGGPDSNSLSVHISQMKSTLLQHNLRIDTRRGPGATYRLIKDDPQ